MREIRGEINFESKLNDYRLLHYRAIVKMLNMGIRFGVIVRTNIDNPLLSDNERDEEINAVLREGN